jgi:hypothetical protein
MVITIASLLWRRMAVVSRLWCALAVPLRVTRLHASNDCLPTEKASKIPQQL